MKPDVDDLPVDVFEVADLELTPRSLTAGHGMPESGASGVVLYCSGCSCACTGNLCFDPGDVDPLQVL